MLESFKSYFHEELNYAPITLFGEKLKIGVVGGGRGALIKVKNFYNKGSKIEVLALNFLDEFSSLDKSSIKLIKKSYYKKFIEDKHIIIIAIDDENVINEIKKDCDDLHKIYINSSKFKEGMGVIPVTRESNNITVAVNTKAGNPRGAILTAEAIVPVLDEYDCYISITGKIRNNLMLENNVKQNLIRFINLVDCKYFYDKGEFINVLKLFYDEDIVNSIIELEKEE